MFAVFVGLDKIDGVVIFPSITHSRADVRKTYAAEAVSNKKTTGVDIWFELIIAPNDRVRADLPLPFEDTFSLLSSVSTTQKPHLNTGTAFC
jgi:hypothetical protein